MFDVNNHSSFKERGYLPPRQNGVRADLAEAMMRKTAESIGFELQSWQQEPDCALRMSVKVSGYREHGPSNIVAGSAGKVSARYLMDVRTEEVPLSRQVYSLLQLTLDWHGSYQSVLVEVAHEDGTPGGRLNTNRAARQAIFEAALPFQAVREMADEDTLSDALMPVVIRGIPRRL